MIGHYDTNGGRTAFVSPAVLELYDFFQSKQIRSLLRRLILRLEGGPMYSLTAREIFCRHHGVDVGLFTMGPCEAAPERFGRRTIIGRYSSIYWTASVASVDCQVSGRVPHRPFGEAASGEAMTDAAPLMIGHDVFIGHNAIILPSVERIGDGVFIGAGSVVQTNIPPYAVVTGNPARVVRYRFTEAKIKELVKEQWWIKAVSELGRDLESFQKPLETDMIH
jgi:virginiamycin A acetyltransferase